MKLKKAENRQKQRYPCLFREKENQIINECVKTRMSGIFGGGDSWEK